MTGNVVVLLSNGKVIQFNEFSVETIPFAWGAGYDTKDLDTLSGVYLSHDLDPNIYTIPRWAK